MQKVIKKYNLEDKSHLIFNVDEKGITLIHTPPQVVAGAEFLPNYVTSGKSVTTTILRCGIAIGTTIPPILCFGRQTPFARTITYYATCIFTDEFMTFRIVHFLKWSKARNI
jgi:hypothetical protein